MFNKFLSWSIIVCFSMFSVGSCGGGGANKLYLASMTDSTGEMGGVATDELGNIAVGFQRTVNTGTLAGVLVKTSEGNVHTIIAGNPAISGQQEGFPVQTVSYDGNHKIEYSNWTSSTVDITLTDGVTGDVESHPGVKYSDYIAGLTSVSSDTDSVNITASDWGGFFGALGLTIKLGTCPAAAILSVSSFGWLSFTMVSCVVAAGSLWSMLDSEPALVNSAVTPVNASADCISLKAGTNTAVTRNACIDDSKLSVLANGHYIDSNKNAGVDSSDGSSEFAGSCDQKLAQGTCVNYNGSAISSSAVQNACTSVSGTYSSSKCTTSTNVGVCTVSSGSTTETAVIYYSAFFNSTTAQATCTAMGGTWSSTYL